MQSGRAIEGFAGRDVKRVEQGGELAVEFEPTWEIGGLAKLANTVLGLSPANRVRSAAPT
jgi:hypothetical protein